MSFSAIQIWIITRTLLVRLDNVTVASVWQGGDPNSYTSANFPAWLAKQENQGVVLHRNFSATFHNNRQPVSDQLSCGTASTFVTANTGPAITPKVSW